jgi:hypothetical protein
MGNSAGVDEVTAHANLPETIRHLNFRPVNETLAQQVRGAVFLGWRLDGFRNVKG